MCVCVADIQEKLNCFILSGPRFIGLRVCKGKWLNYIFFNTLPNKYLSD